MAVTSSIPRGTILSGKYKVGRELGRGGMAAVYRAVNVDIDKNVAIKLLAGHLSTSSTVVERFLREARAVSKIKSPHICDVFDSGRLEDGTPFLVMELLEGESLYDAMCRDRQMSPELTLSIVLQVSRGLAKAHEQNIVHRDLKPENIFLTVNEDGQLLVKILDFGLAKFYDPVETKGKGKHARLTREGAVFGTPAYMSPEQVRGQAAADTRADLWALACITYECLTGTTVWSTEDGVAMTFAQIATAPLPNPRSYRPDLPESFTEWFKRALDRNIDNRFQTVKAFADGLATAFDYRASGGGLDSRLVEQITLAADPNAVTQRRSNRPKPPATKPKPPPPPPPSKGRGAEPAPPPSQSSPQRSASPSPVSLQEHPSIPPEVPQRGLMKRVITAALVGAVAVAGLLTIRKLNREQPPPILAKRFGDLSALVNSHDTEQASGLKYEAAHPWLRHLRDAQAFIADGKYDEALGMLRRLNEREPHPLLKNLIDQVDVASQGAAQSARCQVTGYGRPRRGDLLSQDKKAGDALAPTIVVGIKGAVMAWADTKDGPRRAYAVPLDEKLSNTKLPVDITPEGTRVSTPLLMPLPSRFLSMYADSAGAATGIYLRWLNADAVIDAEPVLAADKSPVSFATASRNGDGFVVAWAERRDSDAVDLYYRRFDQSARPEGDLVRLTDLQSRGSAPSEIREVRVVEQSGKLNFVYEYNRGQVQQIRYMQVPADTKPPGLMPPAAGAPDGERALVDVVELSLPTVKAYEPSLACNAEGCFVAWTQSVQNGASVAFIDGKTGKRQWHKLFAPQGRHPALAAAPNGEVQIVWVEGARIHTASVSRDGVGPSSRVARVIGDHPAPVIAAGLKRGEWYVAFLDLEVSRREPYAVRMQCQ
jgi:serine/threonine-protein kinase